MAQQKRAAFTLLKKRLDEVERCSFTAGSDRLTFAQLADRYIESKVNVRPSTRRSYASLIELYLKPCFGEMRIERITAALIEDYRNRLAVERLPAIADAFAARLRAERPALSKARARRRAMQTKPGIRTINKSLTLMVMIFNYAARHRWVDHNPAEHVEKLKAPVSAESALLDNNILSPQEITRLLNAAEPARLGKDGMQRSNNYQLVIKFAIFTGVRSGELRGLQWGDVDWRSNQVHIRRAWKEGQFQQPKTRTSVRRIDLPKVLVDELREWKLGCPKGEHDLVFPNTAGKPMSSTNLLQRGFYPALRRAGLRQVRFHDLRHTFASLLIANGEDIVRVSRLLGHASPAITLKVYSHMLPKEHYGSADRLANLIFPENAHLGHQTGT